MEVVKEELKIQPQENIVEKYRSALPTDFLGFECGEYFLYMDFTHAQEFMKEEARNADGAEADWNDHTRSVDEALEKMKDYMPFAWGKAKNFRGISSDRSIRHYVAWSWLIGDEAFSTRIDNTNYEFYGKDILVMICEHYGWDHKQWDDGVRQNSETY